MVALRFSLMTLLALAWLLGSAAFPPGAADKSKKDDAPKPPPEGAVVLFDGKHLSEWVTLKGQPAQWKVEDGYTEVVPGKGNIKTKRTFGDGHYHEEFWLPLMADKK